MVTIITRTIKRTNQICAFTVGVAIVGIVVTLVYIWKILKKTLRIILSNSLPNLKQESLVLSLQKKRDYHGWIHVFKKTYFLILPVVQATFLNSKIRKTEKTFRNTCAVKILLKRVLSSMHNFTEEMSSLYNDRIHAFL